MIVTAQHNKITAGTRSQSKIQNPKYKIKRGFTLIELLVVIALLAVLLTLIFKPLVDTFNLTSRAGTQIEAQAAARDTLREVTTTLSDAAYIYDNSSNPINIWVPTYNAAVPTPINAQKAVPTSYAMAEYVRPSRQFDQSTGLPSDPTTGDPIYAGKMPAQSGYSLPLTAGRTLGRLFIGLADNSPAPDTSQNTVKLNGMPAKPYFNTYEEPRVNNKDNRYTLYRAEVQTFIADPNNTTPTPTYIPNLKLFHTMNNAGAIIDTKAGTIQLHDPNFFYDNSLAGGNENGAGTAVWAMPGAKPTGSNGTKYTIADNWRAVSSTLLLPKKVDAVALNRNADTNAALYYAPGSDTIAANPGSEAHIRPLITFAPLYVENDPGTPASVENSGNEAIAPAAVTFQTQYSNWDNPYRVQVFRATDATSDPLSQNILTYYEYDPTTNKIMLYTALPGVPPGAPSMIAAGPMVDPATGAWTGPGDKPYTDKDFFAYSVDPRAGAVNFAFPWSVLCHDAMSNNYAPLPQTYTALEINSKIDPTAGPLTYGYGKRYVELGVLSPTMPASALSPLDPAKAFGTSPTAKPALLPRISIVAGSERVFGPDQKPGPHYGYRTQYTRVSASADAPGLNQYKINYYDVPNAASATTGDPRVAMGYVEFDSGSDISEDAPNYAMTDENTVPPMATADPTVKFRPHSLPQYKYQNGANAASDPVEISYSFQMNRPNDVVKADYLTRELMNISMNIRYYDQRSSRPQEMNLTGQVKVRNLQR